MTKINNTKQNEIDLLIRKISFYFLRFVQNLSRDGLVCRDFFVDANSKQGLFSIFRVTHSKN